MTNAPTQAAPADVTAIDTHARGPLLLLLGSGLVWLVISGILALIASIQLHSPAFMADCAWLTIGRGQALAETSFVYGWLANAGLATALWVLGRLGGNALRASNWTVVGTLFWNTGIAAGLIGIATGDMTSFSLLQLPRYVLPFLVFAYATIAMAGVLAWSGRRSDGAYASQWYAVAALFLFPWLLTAAQAVLLWFPLRGVAQAVAAAWFMDGAWALWLAPLALAGAYYVVPKVAGRTLPAYESAPLGFWTLIFLGAWTGGRHLVGGPVPAWIATVAVVAQALLVFHFFVVALNLRVVLGADGVAARFLRFGLFCYVLTGLVGLLTSFRAVALHTQFTLLTQAQLQLGLYGGLSMIFFGVIYFMLPRVTGRAWASPALVTGHRAVTGLGVLLLVVGLGYAGWQQSADLLEPKVGLGAMAGNLRTPLLMVTTAQALLLTASLLVVVNFIRTSWDSCCGSATADRSPSRLEAHAS